MIDDFSKVKCPFCSKQADLFTRKGATRHIVCDNCGEYIITLPAERLLEANDFGDKLYLLSSKTFEKNYYENGVLTIGAKQIENLVDISFCDKVYRLARYIYVETKRIGLGKKIETIRPQSHYCRNTGEYIYALDTLQSSKIITYEKIGGENGGDRVMAMSPKLTSMAMLSFEEDIENLDDFKRAFMGSFSKNAGVSISVNSASGSQINVALQDSKINATQNNNPALSEVQNLLDDLLSKIPAELPNETREEIKDIVSAVKAEMQNPVPNKSVIKPMLFGLKAFLRGTELAAAVTTILGFFVQ
jgi:uncharacterized Zn-finger protein